MKSAITVHQVEGQKYEVWSDYIERATFAKATSGEVKRICGGGYIHADLTVRKAIANAFGHKTFRK